MVDEFNRKHFNLRQLLELRHIDVLSLCDVEEHSIDEKQECLYVQELAPGQAKVKEELCQSLVIDATPVLFFKLPCFCKDFLLSPRPEPIFLVLIHILLVFFVKLLI